VKSYRNTIPTQKYKSQVPSGLRKEGKSKLSINQISLYRVGQFRLYKVETKQLTPP